MGNQSSILQNYKLEHPFEISKSNDTPTSAHSGADEEAESAKTEWVLYPAKHSDGSLASVFFYELTNDKSNADLGENAAKYCKVLRHPGMPRFVCVERVAAGCMLLTEPLTPLGHLLDQLTAAEVCAGLHSLLHSLVFLHDTAGVCHNNLCLSSVFVAADGSWKLGSLGYATRRPVAPNEEGGYAQDAYAFGLLAEVLLEYLTPLGDLTKTFELRMQDEFLNPDPSRRPQLRSLLDDRLFTNDFLEILSFLKNMTLKSSEQKENFFSSLTQRLFHLPIGVLARRLVKPLLSRFVLLEPSAVQHVVPHLLAPAAGSERRAAFAEGEVNPLLPEAQFRRHVIPEVFKIFHVRDGQIRSILLRHLAAYVHLFEQNTLKLFVFPQILLGLRDSDDDLVALTLHSLAALVPSLGGDLVIGAKRSRLFRHSPPKLSSRATAEGSISPPVDLNKSNATRDTTPPERRKSERKAELEARREERRQRREKRSSSLRDAVRQQTGKETETRVDLAHSDSDADLSDSDTVAPSTPVDSGPPVTVDWSHVQPTADASSAPTRQTRALRLKKDEKGISPPKPRPLGAEFDVMAIEVVASVPAAAADDPIAAMFAQMQPDIKAPTSLLGMLKSDTTLATPSGVFDMLHSKDAPDDGWGDDLDWAMIEDP